jgi:protein-tyrosine-phosphatase
MSRGHAQAVAALVPSATEKVIMLDPGGDIEDPVGSDMPTYRKVASQLKTLIEKRLDESPVL